MPQECIGLARLISRAYPKILPALEVIEESEKLSKGRFWNQIIGKGQSGHSIKLLSWPRTKSKNVLFYGFTDPGEAVGATGLLCLMKALKDGHPFLTDLELNWHFIPCVNLHDQPNGGKTLDKVMKTGQQEIDWLVHQPRPETTALLMAAREIKPIITFPLHDEWHCHEKVPSYMAVSHTLSPEICQGLKEILTTFGLEISHDLTDREMGPGFLNMNQADDIKNSTFYEFSKTGLVFICEVPDLPGTPDREIIAAQLAAMIFVLVNH